MTVSIPQKVVEAYRDKEEARKTLERLVKSPINKSIGPAYRKLIMDMITESKVDSALRQVWRNGFFVSFCLI